VLKDIVIIGAGGFAREVAWLIEEINAKEHEWNLLGYIDENKKNHNKVLNGTKILGDFEWLQNRADTYAVCAVGNTESKMRLVKKAEDLGVKFPILVHPSVMNSKYNEIGEGSIICAGNILTTNIRIGKHVIVNLDCTIGHDTIIDDYCTILPSVNVSGSVNLKQGCDIGTGTAIIQGVTINEWTIVGAGAVVTKDLPSYCTAVGMPAKPIKYRNNQ